MSLHHIARYTELVMDNIERNRKNLVTGGMSISNTSARQTSLTARGGERIKAAPLTPGATVLKIVDRAIDADLVSHVPIL